MLLGKRIKHQLKPINLADVYKQTELEFPNLHKALNVVCYTMTHQTLKQLAETIEASNESIDLLLQENKLIIKTKKNGFWIFLSLIGIAFSILLISTYNKGQNNLEIGLVVFGISICAFWRMQSINKTLIIDLNQKTISVIPNFVLQHFILSKILKINTIFSLSDLPDMYLLQFRNLNYHWTQRIYIKKGIWTIYLLEFDRKQTAQKVLQLLRV